MKTLVTGGAGFIGSHLSEKLLSRGHEVTVVDNLSTGKKENIKHLKGNKNFNFIEGDVTDIKKMIDICKEKDAIFHLAAFVSVASSVENPLQNHEVNVDGSFSIFNAAKINKVKKIIMASSAAVYGSSVIGDEFNPISPYGTSKVMMEYYARLFSHCYNIDTVCLRYFNVYGPKQDPNSEYSAVIPKFIWSMLKNERPVVHGDGEQTRNFIYVDDVVRANIKSLESNIDGSIYMDIAGNESISINTLFKKIKSNIAFNMDPIIGTPNEGDIKYSFARPENARKYIGFLPKTNFDLGLKNTIEYFQTKL